MTTATKITCAPSTTSPIIGANYTVSGRLTTTAGAGVASAPIEVAWSNDNEGTWHFTAAYCTTNSNGNYSYTQTGQAWPGEWEYVIWVGNSNYGSCNSIDSVWQAVGVINDSITLNLSYSSPLYVGNTITMTGVLQTTSGTKLGGKTIDLYYNQTNQNPWNIQSGAATTDANGNYTILVAASYGTWYFATHWAGDRDHAVAWSTHYSATAQNQPPPPSYNTTLSCYVSNSTPQDGTTITFDGALLTSGGAAVQGALISLYLGASIKGQAYTDATGYYAISITAIDGTNSYLTKFAGQTIGGTVYNSSQSFTVSVTGSAAIVDATVTLTKIDIEAKPNGVVFYDMGTPIVVNAECAPVNPAVSIGIYPSVVAAECAPVITDFPPANVYPNILAQQVYVFPPGIEPECEPNSMAVSQLSTSVLPAVVQPEAFTENYCEVDTTAQGNAGIVTAECSVPNPRALVSNPLLLEVNAIISEDLETNALIEDTVYLGVKIKKELEIQLEVTTE